MSRQIVLLNQRAADLFDLEIRAPITESALIDAVIHYAEAHNGMQGVAFHYDPVMWRILAVNENIRLSMANLIHYMSKCIETAEED